MVTEVDPTMSEAMLWTHPDFRVSAMSEDGAAFGIIQGHLASATSAYLMELHGIPFRTSLKPGALIVSSGLGGVWPRGIPIAHVLQEVKTTEGWARTYLVKPAVSPADVGAVMILKPERVTKPFDNVWASVVGADQAAARIVATGDSTAKAAALAEAAATRAARDSLRDTTAGGQIPGGLPPELRADTLGGAVQLSDSARAEAVRRAAAARRAAARRDSARRDSVRRDSTNRTDSLRSPTRGF
jgi:rod shape-determining protein MreC